MKTHEEYAREHPPAVPCRPEHMKTPYRCSNCGFEMHTYRGWHEGSGNYDFVEDSAPNEGLRSTRITDDELFSSLAVKATKNVARDRERLKKEADLHRLVLADLTPIDVARNVLKKDDDGLS